MATNTVSVLLIFVMFCAECVVPNGGVKLGLLITTDNVVSFSNPGLVISGAMTLAVDDVNRNPALLPNTTLEFVWNNTEGYEDGSIRALTDQWRDGVVAFFGPGETCTTEARIAASWNVPMISYMCSEYPVSDKSQYPTFARTLPPDTQVCNSILALLENFGWNNVTLVVSETETWKSVAANLWEILPSNNITIAFQMDFAHPYLPGISKGEDGRDPLFTIVDQTYIDTRIYIVLGKYFEALEFAHYLYEMDLLVEGEYMVITVELDQEYNRDYPQSLMQGPFEADLREGIIEAYRSVLVLVPSPPSNPDYALFEREVDQKSKEPPFNFSSQLTRRVRLLVSITRTHKTATAAYLYDSVMIYAHALHRTIQKGGSVTDGQAIIKNVIRRQYESVLGNMMYIDHNGDAEINITVLALKPFTDPVTSDNTYGLLPVAIFREEDGRPVFQITAPEGIDWVGGSPPLVEPPCGFRGQRCVSPPGVAKFKYLNVSQLTMNSDTAQVFAHVGYYKGASVAIKWVHKNHVDLTRSVRKELKLMKDLRHDNIATFIGACVDSPNICIITEYCTKGSLTDILENTDVKLDTMFTASIVTDILKGMIYLHSSELKSHGNLKSSNCVVDSRWVVKVTDFGLQEFKAGSKDEAAGEHAYYRNLLWKAPELLRGPSVQAKGTQKGDVYAFGIILYEIEGREGPYGTCAEDPKEIVEKVRAGADLFRPDTQHLDCEKFVIDVMHICWAELPESRPEFKAIRNLLKPMKRGMKSNIFDNMMNIMEKYANNLEELVEERTHQLVEEKKKTDALLYSMLPKTVADQLKRGKRVDPESFDMVTIFFSDIVGFTLLSAESTPLQVVDLLNDLYTCFDDIISNFDVYKVETIGDAYMVVSGLPIQNGDRHGGEIASMALALLKAVSSFKIRHRADHKMHLRIGIHSGPCCAGVVGLKMPRYCLFGDTVNTASRMESNGQALKIHCSQESKNVLDRLGGYHLVKRGVIPMKGKGDLVTYWLVGEDKSGRHNLPPPPPSPCPRSPYHPTSNNLKAISRKLSPLMVNNFTQNDLNKSNRPVKRVVQRRFSAPPAATMGRRASYQLPSHAGLDILEL
ncbi:receptor-type guanylate cyclase Gyc76C-like [Branchiostoma lanceolatum]|uniref:receptor-type guanylate cyclase Gyc76C-like n=1 Tax=Branchiostoma lanceolatum TaxID=7740 RepID=UPI003452BA8F